jgi:hypothetical protein
MFSAGPGCSFTSVKLFVKYALGSFQSDKGIIKKRRKDFQVDLMWEKNLDEFLP